MTAKRRNVLEPVRAGIRRFQLIVGLGLLSVILGAVLAPLILLKLAGMVSTPNVFWVVTFTAVGQLWVWAVLPGLLYAVGRIIDLRPWTAAVGSVVTGVLFVAILAVITSGWAGLYSDHPARLVTQLLTSVAGVFLGRTAVVSARAAAKLKEEETARAALARKGEYEQFAKEAERLAAQHGAQPSAAQAQAAPDPSADPVSAAQPEAGADAEADPSGNPAPTAPRDGTL